MNSGLITKKERQKLASKRYYEKHKQELFLKRKEYNKKNREVLNEKARINGKIYREKNREKVRAYHREYMQERMKVDSLFKKKHSDCHKRWVAKNKEHIRNWFKGYRNTSEKYRNYLKEYHVKYYQANKGKFHKYAEDYFKRHGHYPGKDNPSQKDRFSSQNHKWRSDVKKRDNYTCQGCGKKHCKICAHHIKPWKDYPELRFILSNGITLCVECHKEADKTKNANIVAAIERMQQGDI